ncbi:MAG: hypothetical protein QXX85_04815 [Candidatus Nitrosotenuis sp.]
MKFRGVNHIKKQSLLTGDGNTNVSGEHKTVIRRSITVEDQLNNFINILRARFLEHEGKEIDFTTMINALAAIGANRFSKREEMSDKEWKIFNSYLDFSDLHLEAAKDEYQDRWLKYELPKFNFQSTGKDDNSNSVKRTKKEDVSEPE